MPGPQLLSCIKDMVSRLDSELWWALYHGYLTYSAWIQFWFLWATQQGGTHLDLDQLWNAPSLGGQGHEFDPLWIAWTSEGEVTGGGTVGLIHTHTHGHALQWGPGSGGFSAAPSDTLGEVKEGGGENEARDDNKA